jgi:protein involved in polysaccharide export with SLBB domain
MRQLITGLVAVFLFSACSPVLKQSVPIDYQTMQASPSPEQPYKIQIGDQLDVKFFYNPELNEQVTVRPDGHISLQLVHEIGCAGLTPAELTKLLAEKYAPELKQPEITVIVRSFGAQKIFVDGEVTKPGMLPILGLMTVLQAISQAGGMKESARVDEVIIIRRGAANRPLAFPVNLQKALDGTDMSQDIALAPFDIVYVPRSPVADVNMWIDQYIRKNVPFPISFQYSF